MTVLVRVERFRHGADVAVHVILRQDRPHEVTLRVFSRPGTQYWYARADAALRAGVNGRSTYWGCGAPIPGGVAFENFEMLAPYRRGQAFTFGVSPKTPKAIRQQLARQRRQR